MLTIFGRRYLSEVWNDFPHVGFWVKAGWLVALTTGLRSSISKAVRSSSPTEASPLLIAGWQFNADLTRHGSRSSKSHATIVEALNWAPRSNHLKLWKEQPCHQGPPSLAKVFTLKELLITIAILFFLAAMLLPYLSRYGHGRVPSRRTTCLNNVKQLALACATYESTNSQYPSVVGSDGESFLVRILPMLDQKTMYDDFRGATNRAEGIDNLARNELEILRCSSAALSDFQATDNGSFTSHYVGCAGFTKPISTTTPTPSDSSTDEAPPIVFTGGPGDLGLNGLFSPKLNEDGTLNIGNKNGLDTTEVVDGLSNTMAIIETSRGDLTSGAKTFTNARVRWSWGADPVNSNQVNWGRSVDRRD